MPKRLFKVFPLTVVTLFSLTSCKFVANIVGTILVNAAVNLPVLVNGVDILPEGKDSEPALIEFAQEPSAVSARANLDYFKNVLVIPNTLESEVLGSPIKVTFETIISGDEGAADSFKTMIVTKDELPSDFNFDLSSLPVPVDFSLKLLIPIGESDLLDDVTSFNDLTSLLETKSQKEIIEATDQVAKNVKIEVSARSGSTKKSKDFYFNLVKPEFGALILDEVFNSNYLVNIYHEKDNSLENLSTLPKDALNPLGLTFFRDSLAIPKSVDLKDVGLVEFEVSVNRPELFFISEMSKPIEEVDPGNTLIEGNVEVFTFTPLGTYRNKVPGSVVTVDDLRAHIRSIDTKELYEYATQESQDFSLSVSAKVHGEERSETFYFNLSEPMIDQEIVDYVIESEYMVNTVFYKDTSTINQVNAEDLPNSPAKRLSISYLTETIAIPQDVILSDFGNKQIHFDFEIIEGDASYFYESTKEDVLDGNPVTVKTFTPVGAFSPLTPPNDLDAFASEVRSLSTEDLYAHATQTSKDVALKITATLNENSATETFYFSLDAANVDKEIVDYLIDDAQLLNVVNYEDVDDDEAIEKIGNLAKDELAPYPIEHLVDTLIIPEEITLTNFGNKKLNVTSSVVGLVNIFDATKSALISGNNIIAKTLTPLGTFDDSSVEDGNLTALSNALKALPTKDLYNHSQAANIELTINVTIDLMDEFNVVQESRSTTFYLEVVKANVDKKIGEQIMNQYDIVNIIKHTNPNESMPNPPQTQSVEDAYDLDYFKETLVFPVSYEFDDFVGKTISFDIDLHGSEAYFFTSLKSHIYEGKTITAQTFSPIGTYDASSVTTFNELITHISANHTAIEAHNASEVVRNLTITVTTVIDGNSVASRTYYFVMSPY